MLTLSLLGSKVSNTLSQVLSSLGTRYDSLSSAVFKHDVIVAKGDRFLINVANELTDTSMFTGTTIVSVNVSQQPCSVLMHSTFIALARYPPTSFQPDGRHGLCHSVSDSHRKILLVQFHR